VVDDDDVSVSDEDSDGAAAAGSTWSGETGDREILEESVGKSAGDKVGRASAGV